MSKLRVFSDGASRGNPGPSGIGVGISDNEGNTLKELSEHIGNTTNNVAEYSALVRALEEALLIGGTEIEIFTDSELVARQITGVYQVKAQHLLPFVQKVRDLLQRFQRKSISHVLREENSKADDLARKASKLIPDLT